MIHFLLSFQRPRHFEYGTSVFCVCAKYRATCATVERKDDKHEIVSKTSHQWGKELFLFNFNSLWLQIHKQSILSSRAVLLSIPWRKRNPRYPFCCHSNDIWLDEASNITFHRSFSPFVLNGKLDLKIKKKKEERQRDRERNLLHFRNHESSYCNETSSKHEHG